MSGRGIGQCPGAVRLLSPVVSCPPQLPWHERSRVSDRLAQAHTDSCGGEWGPEEQPLLARAEGLRDGGVSRQRLRPPPAPHDPGLFAHRGTVLYAVPPGPSGWVGGRPDLRAAKKTNTDVFGWDRERENCPLPPACALLEAWGWRRPAGLSGQRGAGERLTVPRRPLLPPWGARGPSPLSGVSPGALLAFSLSLLLYLGLPSSHPLALGPSPRPGLVPFNFLLSRGENFACERAAARRRYWPAPRPAAPPPRPRAPLRPPLPARVAAAAEPSEACVRVCECAPASVSECVCAPGAGWAALRPRRERREPGGRVVTRARGQRRRRRPGEGWDWGSGGRAGHGAGKPALRQDAPASSEREALAVPRAGAPAGAGQTFLSLLPFPEVKS